MTQVRQVLAASAIQDGHGEALAYMLADQFTPIVEAIVTDALADALHPEFGTEWQEPNGTIYKAWVDGWNECLDTLEAKMGPDYLEFGQTHTTSIFALRMTLDTMRKPTRKEHNE